MRYNQVIFASTAATALASILGETGKCSYKGGTLDCASPLVETSINKTECRCDCGFDEGEQCQPGKEKVLDTCECRVNNICNNLTCEDPLVLNERVCKCTPPSGTDWCSYEGNFLNEDGTDCLGNEIANTTQSGAVAQVSKVF